MKKALKIFTLLTVFFVLISSVASAAWSGAPQVVSESAHLLVIGISLISTGCLLRDRKESRSAKALAE